MSKRGFASVAAVFFFSALAVPLFAEPPELSEGIRIEADGGPIDVKVGHLVPVVADWDGDGKKDLLVGQFMEGKIRFYRNVGEDASPKFGDSRFIQAGGKDISVPCG